MTHSVPDTPSRYIPRHPSWCDGGHDGAHHSRSIDGLVRITWTDTIDGEPADDDPIIQVLADEHLELGDARRLAVALSLAVTAVGR